MWCMAVLFAAGILVPSLSAENQDDQFREQIFITVPESAISRGIFKSALVESLMDCAWMCLSEHGCKSGNFQKTGDPKHLCELSNHTLGTRQVCKVDRPGYTHFGPYDIPEPDPCATAECKNAGTCVPECNARRYKCECNPANTGADCDRWTVSITSCKDIYTKTSHRQDMAYALMVDSKQTDVYCHMSSICGSGGWTLVMKTDGAKSTFDYGKAYWSNKLEFHPEAGKTGLDRNETKLSTYWSIPFQQVCVGIRVGETVLWGVVSYTTTSLYDVIADGAYRPVTAGRSMWLGLLAGSSLQANCNREGFNTLRRMRFGIMTNQENDCGSCDSWIGFGYGNLACGNQCSLTCSSGDKTIRAFGYILIR